MTKKGRNFLGLSFTNRWAGLQEGAVFYDKRLKWVEAFLPNLTVKERAIRQLQKVLGVADGVLEKLASAVYDCHPAVFHGQACPVTIELLLRQIMAVGGLSKEAPDVVLGHPCAFCGAHWEEWQAYPCNGYVHGVFYMWALLCKQILFTSGISWVSLAMKFRLLPNEAWFEGNEGHLAFKEYASHPENENTTFAQLQVGNSETPIADMPLVNIIAALGKSSNHIAHITGRPFEMAIDSWRLFKANDRSAETLKTQLETNALVKLVGVDNVEGNIIQVRMFDQPKPFTTVCAVTRRLANLIEWASKVEKKLVSTTKFKWDTFDMISARQKYVEPKAA